MSTRPRRQSAAARERRRRARDFRPGVLPAVAGTDSRIYLTTPYAEKDAAKALGARWDPHRKRWWIDSHWPGRDRFARWLPTAVKPTPPAPTGHTCPGCGTAIAAHVDLCAPCRDVHPRIRRRRRLDRADRFLSHAVRVDGRGSVLTPSDLS